MIGTIRDALTGRPRPLTEVAFLIQQAGQAGHSLERDCLIPVELPPTEGDRQIPVWSSALWPAVGQAICGVP